MSRAIAVASRSSATPGSAMAKPSPMSPADAFASSRSGTSFRNTFTTNATRPTGAAHRNTDWREPAWAATTGAMSTVGWLCRPSGETTASGDSPGDEAKAPGSAAVSVLE